MFFLVTFRGNFQVFETFCSIAKIENSLMFQPYNCKQKSRHAAIVSFSNLLVICNLHCTSCDRRFLYRRWYIFVIVLSNIIFSLY
jgi:hypothetical protein